MNETTTPSSELSGVVSRGEALSVTVENEKPQRWMILMVVEQGEGEGKPEHWDWTALAGSQCWAMASLPVIPGEDMYVALEKDTGWLVIDKDGDPVWE